MNNAARRVDVSVARTVAFESDLTDPRIADLVEFALQQEHADGDWQVALALMDSVEMGQLHLQFMGLSGPTDILTFPYDEEAFKGGDIAICVPVAADQAAEHGNALDEELAFLVLHGVLHLIGYDDATDASRSAMLDRQQDMLDTWKLVSQ